ncbi:hypothetical protein O7627_20625 [Solwaraspora sp. WMMD1047]|uniref:hypothetical protein n=1 Tax=Solwaraspora sp. WMMD1047 TaxID=3016102 RepID=UPI002416FE0C|nr:hypothetical protein [Solwaraspora sp. WMMD1047]MDG4831689.1 hypothetical protein [Solwaraspora sp. WMMD1047]
MDVEDGQRVTASLAEQLDRVTFTNLSADEVTALIIGSAVDWATGQGWRVYRRAASVLPLPPPLSGRHSVVDVACARPDGPPLVIEVDRTDRARTVEKLSAEAAAGRIAIWVRWGTGPFAAPPPPVHLVTCAVSRRPGPGGAGRRYSRTPASGDRPAPAHSTVAGGSTVAAATAVELPIPELAPDDAAASAGD